MISRAIILHGIAKKKYYYNLENQDSQSNAHWLPWLQQQLCARDILAQTPEMPRPFEPNYQDWSHAFELLKPDADTLLVGHSFGGGFLLRWLSENPDEIVGKVVVVAPWLDIEKMYMPLFDFKQRSDIALQSRAGIDVLHSTDDMLPVQTTVDYLRNSVDGVRFHEFTQHGHFDFNQMNTREFPELLQICLDE